MSADTEDKNEKRTPDNSNKNSESNEKELASVCEQLDALALAYLDKMEMYSNNWDRTSDHFQQVVAEFFFDISGFLHLAHAKYAMGSSKISSLYYDERMKAQARVCIDDKTGTISLLDGPFDENKDDEKQTQEPNKEPAKVATLTLPRRRKKAAQKDKDDKENEQPEAPPPPPTETGATKSSSTATTRRTTTKNPLNWFGLFVSPSLRVSQTHFTKATHELLDQVNCLKELATLEEQYRALDRQKKTLLKETQDQDNKD